MYTNEEFIAEIKDSAITACKGSGLFPSVIIAQACLESNYGLSRLSLNCNNFFGVKAGSHWTGPVRNFPTNEFLNGKNITVNADFAAFKDFEDCLEYHNAMLNRVQTYRAAGLFKCKTPESQANILRVAGYATDPHYPGKLVAIINQFGLRKYDVNSDGDVIPFINAN